MPVYILNQSTVPGSGGLRLPGVWCYDRSCSTFRSSPSSSSGQVGAPTTFLELINSPQTEHDRALQLEGKLPALRLGKVRYGAKAFFGKKNYGFTCIAFGRPRAQKDAYIGRLVHMLHPFLIYRVQVWPVRTLTL